MGEGEPGSRWHADGGTYGLSTATGAGRCHSARKQGNGVVCVGCA
jgi:hypothetical protein